MEEKQSEFFDMEPEETSQGPVECLGMTFENDEARRTHFLNILREKLKDPKFRKIEGFPIGEDEDILALSDPPYYTACPNPFVADFVKHYGKPYDSENDNYQREPFAIDVSEGKNSPIFKAHSYHTKVPHKAIMRYILHYTNPGDIVLDGFCGTGMTGVAAHLCGDTTTLESLGFKICQDGRVLDEAGQYFSKRGERYPIINDLSPIASFIAYNLNSPVDVVAFEHESKRILKEIKGELGWMYETLHTDGKTKGEINYVIWSDIIICPECQESFVYWDVAVDYEKQKVHKNYPCPNCSVSLSREKLERKIETLTDHDLGIIINRPKQCPVLINYSVGTKRYEKQPDKLDMEVIAKLESQAIPHDIPKNLMCFKGTDWGDLCRGYHLGTTHVHQFYTKRNRWILASAKDKIEKTHGRLKKYLLAWFTASHSRLTRLNRYMPNHGRHVGPLSGTYYISSLPTEISPFYFMSVKIRDFANIHFVHKKTFLVSVHSTTNSMNIPNNCIDYIFTDPPFGDNLPYSELNFLWEAWLRVLTNNFQEAIVSKFNDKGINEYSHLMEKCFACYFKILKPGRWITVEFHNSRNSVWNSIQEALGKTGFIVADVRTLDKKKGTTKQLTYISGAVKQDLVISAYKPNCELEERFKLSAGTEKGVWDFLRTHLMQLPIFVVKQEQVEIIVERQNYLLYDRMVAFHVQRGVSVPLSAFEFYAGLNQHFDEHDGMYFLPEQAAEYYRKRMKVKEVRQLELFVSDEASALQWLREQIKQKPQNFQELHPNFMREIASWSKHEKALELIELLEQNFLCYDGKGEVPSQIHSYLSSNFKDLRNLAKDHSDLQAKAKNRWYVPDPNKASDLEKLREKTLLREFAEYHKAKQKRLKIFRLEAVRAGFKKAWQNRDYETIINVAQKIPSKILEEDPKLLMWYDQALTRSGEEA